MINIEKLKTKQSGQVMLVVVILSILLLSSFVGGILKPLILELRISQAELNSKQSWYLAESVIEDALWRLNNGHHVSSGDELILGGQTAKLTMSSTSGGHHFLATGQVDSAIRKVEARVRVGQGMSFQYGVQTGMGGFAMANNSKVYGNVYSQGNIYATQNTAEITGSAFAANQSKPEPDQSHLGPTEPPMAITFGQEDSKTAVAQSFVPSQSGQAHNLKLNLRRVGQPGNLMVYLISGGDNTPAENIITQGVLPAGFITEEFNWVRVFFDDYADLMVGEKYWLVISGSVSENHYYQWAATDGGYSPGQALVGQLNGSWLETEPAGLAGYFQFFLMGETSSINDLIIGENGLGDARAHEINNSKVAGDLYCQIGEGNDQACDDSLTAPKPQPFPISLANIDTWRREIKTENTIVGDYEPAGDSSALGPVKIEGDLNIPGGHSLTVRGTVWVTGNIVTENNVNIILDSNYGDSSGVIMADGFINLANNTFFDGSGTDNSYILLLSTSDCPVGPDCDGENAILVRNNVEAVILNAQNGTIHFENNAGAKEATAYMISMAQGVEIEYESGLANINFSSGPGGSFQISHWKEIE